mgnify:CR=1 FL=1
MARVDSFYDALADQYGYTEPQTAVAGLSEYHVERRYALVDNADAVFDVDADRLFLASAGMSGPPHLGTLSQLHAARELADAGLDIEFLLADLEKYLGSGMSMANVTDLADRYRGLARELGYKGAIRTQSGDREVMAAAMRLSRYYETDLLPDVDWESTAWEEALDRAYEAAGVDRSDGDGVTEFARKQTGALCAADFLHPLMAEGYDVFVAVLGAEEHALTLRNREMQRRAGVDGRLGGLYTRIVRGLDDYPKMSKRIPPSVISLDMQPSEIRERIHAASDERLWEFLSLASEYSPSELDALEQARNQDRERWESTRAAYADRLAELATYW